MPATLLAAAIPITRAGVDPTGVAVDATNGNSFANTGNEQLYVTNGSGAAITVTFDAFPAGGPGAPGGLTVTDPAVSIPAGARRVFGPFPPSLFNDAGGNVNLAWSAGASVTAAVQRFAANPG